MARPGKARRRRGLDRLLILGIDPAQHCGFALYESSEPLPLIIPGVLRTTGEDYEQRAADLGLKLTKLIRRRRPHFVAIEAPLRVQPGKKTPMKFMGEELPEEKVGSGLNAVISSNQMVGACCAVIGAFGIPFEMISSFTWRKSFLGFGRRPEWGRNDWKRAARQRCEQLRIPVTNDDMAEAVGVAFAGAGCVSFKMLR